MRLIRAMDLKEGMVLGKTLYNPQGVPMLYRGTKLTSHYINKMIKREYSNVYIEDKFSEGIIIEDVVDDLVRQEAIKEVKKFFDISVENTNRRLLMNTAKGLGGSVEKTIEQLKKNKNVIVNLIDLKTHDDYTFQHSVNVAILSGILGLELGYDDKKLYDLMFGAMLHDIGKKFIPMEIINKPSRLDDEEFEEIRKHPILGYEFIKSTLNLPIESLLGILQHHERVDGRGYPYHKNNEEIHLNAKIIKIVDVFDAITSDRVYRGASAPYEAIEYIMSCARTQFNEELIKLFLKKVAIYPLGSTLLLSNHVKGMVIENTEHHLMRPKVRVITNNVEEELYVDLSKRENMNITVMKIVVE